LFNFTMLLIFSREARRLFVVFFLQPFRGRLCRGTPEPHPGFPGRRAGPGSGLAAGNVPGLLSLWALR
jgi:hypothetical protein